MEKKGGAVDVIGNVDLHNQLKEATLNAWENQKTLFHVILLEGLKSTCKCKEFIFRVFVIHVAVTVSFEFGSVNLN